MRRLAFILGLVILFSFSCVTMLSLVSAIEIGQNLSQVQIDNLNFDTVSLQCTFDNLIVNNSIGIIEFDFSCLSLTPNGNRYTVIRQPIPEYYLITEYKMCLNENSRLICIWNMGRTIIEFFKSDKLSLRAWLKEFQTKNADVIQGDFNFTGDLN